MPKSWHRKRTVFPATLPKTISIAVGDRDGQRWVRAIDAWRRKQPRPCPRTDAIKQLARMALGLE